MRLLLIVFCFLMPFLAEAQRREAVVDQVLILHNSAIMVFGPQYKVKKGKGFIREYVTTNDISSWLKDFPGDWWKIVKNSKMHPKSEIEWLDAYRNGKIKDLVVYQKEAEKGSQRYYFIPRANYQSYFSEQERIDKESLTSVRQAQEEALYKKICQGDYDARDRYLASSFVDDGKYKDEVKGMEEEWNHFVRAIGKADHDLQEQFLKKYPPGKGNEGLYKIVLRNVEERQKREEAERKRKEIELTQSKSSVTQKNTATEKTSCDSCIVTGEVGVPALFRGAKLGGTGGIDVNGSRIVGPLEKYIGEKIKFSDKDLASGIDDETAKRHFVSFVIERDGGISDVILLRDGKDGYGEQLVSIIQSTSKMWEPSKVDGRPVRHKVIIPVFVFHFIK